MGILSYFSDPVTTLWLVLALNTSFFIAQFIGAAIARSLAMFGDCSTMAVDPQPTQSTCILSMRRDDSAELCEKKGT